MGARQLQCERPLTVGSCNSRTCQWWMYVIGTDFGQLRPSLGSRLGCNVFHTALKLSH
jgi:hypothetical protein